MQVGGTRGVDVSVAVEAAARTVNESTKCTAIKNAGLPQSSKVWTGFRELGSSDSTLASSAAVESRADYFDFTPDLRSNLSPRPLHAPVPLVASVNGFTHLIPFLFRHHRRHWQPPTAARRLPVDLVRAAHGAWKLAHSQELTAEASKGHGGCFFPDTSWRALCPLPTSHHLATPLSIFDPTPACRFLDLRSPLQLLSCDLNPALSDFQTLELRPAWDQDG